EHLEIAAAERRKLPQRNRHEARGVGVRLLEGDTRLQASDRREAEIAEEDLAAIEAVRDDHRDPAIEEAEGVPKYPDDFSRFAVQHDRAADRRRVGAELRAPVPRRQDDG